MTPASPRGRTQRPGQVLVVTEEGLYQRKGLSLLPIDAVPPVEGKDVRHATLGPTLAVLAGADGRIHLWRGQASEPLPVRIEQRIDCLLLLREDPLDLLVGTRTCRLYRVSAESAEPIRRFDELPVRDQWHTPWGGPPSVRSLAATPDLCLYADIHVGSIMRSIDGGRSWKPVTPGLHEDVHQVATCPAEADRVYANTAASLFVSDDRGQSWRDCGGDLGHRYGRAVAVMPDRPDVLLASVSDGPHGDNVHGQLWRSEDAGARWRQVTDGFPDSTVANIDTFHVAFAADGSAWAIADGQVLASEDAGCSWRSAGDLPSPARMLIPQIPTPR